MPSEIIIYIGSNLSQGISPESIRSNLINKGWKTEQIDQAFLEINSLSEKNLRKSKNNKSSIPFLLGAVLALGVLFIEIGSSFDVESKVEGPAATLIATFQAYLLPTVAFFIPSIFIFATKSISNQVKLTLQRKRK